jgi:hypothetical protein
MSAVKFQLFARTCVPPAPFSRSALAAGLPNFRLARPYRGGFLPCAPAGNVTNVLTDGFCIAESFL